MKSCPHCGQPASDSSRFCVHCGKPLGEAPAPPPAKSPPPPPAGKPVRTGKNRWRTWTAIGIGLVLLSLTAWYFWGRGSRPGEKEEPLAPRSEELFADDRYDPARIERAADTVEAVFAAADTAGLTTILSPYSLDRYRAYYPDLIPHMPRFAADFQNRKLLHATARMAVYEFATDSGAYTIDFCLGEDGAWKLMRF